MFQINAGITSSNLVTVTKSFIVPMWLQLIVTYCIRGLFGSGFNLAVWQIFNNPPNLNNVIPIIDKLFAKLK